MASDCCRLSKAGGNPANCQRGVEEPAGPRGKCKSSTQFATLPTFQASHAGLVAEGQELLSITHKAVCRTVAKSLGDAVAGAQAVIPENWRTILGKKAEDIDHNLARERILKNPTLSDGRFSKASEVVGRWKVCLAQHSALIQEAGLLELAPAIDEVDKVDKELRAVKGTTSVLHTIFIKAEASYVKRFGGRALSTAAVAIRNNAQKESMDVPAHLWTMMTEAVEGILQPGHGSKA